MSLFLYQFLELTIFRIMPIFSWKYNRKNLHIKQKIFYLFKSFIFLKAFVRNSQHLQRLGISGLEDHFYKFYV